VSKKQTTTQNQQQNFNNTSTYDWMKHPGSADIDAVRNFKFTADPRIGYAFGNAKNQAANSFNNPLGGVYSPQMRDSILRSSLSDLAQKEGQAYSEANQGLQGQQFSQRALVANMTTPRLVQSGSSGTGNSSGTTVQSGSMLPDLLSAAIMGGMGALTGGLSGIGATAGKSAIGGGGVGGKVDPTALIAPPGSSTGAAA
jgi:hypothetical protein